MYKSYSFILIFVFIGICSIIINIQSCEADDEVNEQNLNQNDNDNDNYIVIIDAGSSGSRAYIYCWPTNTSAVNKFEFIYKNIKLVNSIRIQPGLANFADDLEKVKPYIEPLVDFITTQVPQNKHQNTQVKLLATAGMRLVDKEKQKALFDEVTKQFTSKSKDLAGNFSAKVISGEHEGVYQWLTVNKLDTRLGELKRATIGMIEMGGSSLQVSYELRPEIDLFISNILKKSFPEGRQVFLQSRLMPQTLSLKISQRRTKSDIFSVSFLGLGSNSGRNLTVDLLIRDYASSKTLKQVFTSLMTDSTQQNLQQARLNISDPCLPVGASEEYAVHRSQLSYSLNSNVFLGMQQSASQNKSEKTMVRLIGAGNFVSCLVLVRRVLRTVKRERTFCKQATIASQEQSNTFTSQIFGRSLFYESRKHQITNRLTRLRKKQKLIGEFGMSLIQSSLNKVSSKKALMDLVAINKEMSPPCTTALLGTPFIPFHLMQFYGLGELFYTTREMIDSSGPLRLARILLRAKKLCSQPYSSLLRDYGESNKEEDPKRVKLECFKVSWVIGFFNESWMPAKQSALAGFMTTDTINSTTVTWTLGAALESVANKMVS